MALTTGTKLGVYEVLAPLGAGGMGEVYRARDTKLSREVALKVLPEVFANDAERVARFQREAQLLAAFSHPNIAQIHGVEESGITPCLVLELVEGETLGERLERGPIAIDEALEIARQIAEGLEAAHARGIMHRDLKPANIKQTPEGNVKVLDFGLAKAFDGGSAAAAPSESPTLLTVAHTQANVILGTAAYMSPEQVRGKAADERSDVWAFGCVLYEMLTGQPPFGGETIVEILGSVMKVEPDWAALPQETPPLVRSVLRRCLQKDRNRRLRHIGDARIEIEEARDEPVGSTAVPLPPKNTRRRSVVTAALVILAAAAAFVIGGVVLRDVPASPPEVRFEVNPPTRYDNWVALSPDGRMLVFGGLAEGKWQLWLRPLDSVTARPLPGTDGGVYPFWSPDSRSLGFFADGQLKRINLAGGPPQRLASAPEPRGGTWGADGTIIFSRAIDGPVYRISADSGGEPTEATQLQPGETSHRFPSFLPDGRRFLYFVPPGENRPGAIHLAAVDNPVSRSLFQSDAAAHYVATGFVLFRRDQTLLAQRFDLATLSLVGEPASIASPVLSGLNDGSHGASASLDGAIAFRTLAAKLLNRFVWFDRSGKEIGQLKIAEDRFETPGVPEISPDGTTVAVHTWVGTNLDVWLFGATRDTTARLTSDAAWDQWPVWSPNGDSIIFSSSRSGNFELYRGSVDNQGLEMPLVQSPGTTIATSWSADGRLLLYTQLNEKTGFDIWVRPLAGNDKPFPLAERPYDEMGAALSKDMRWVAYESNESGRFEIVVQSFPRAGRRITISNGGGTHARWRADGKELYYIAADGSIIAVPILLSQDGQTLVPGSPLRLISTALNIGSKKVGADKPPYAVTPDGQKFLVVVAPEATPPPITVIVNWAARALPTN